MRPRLPKPQTRAELLAHLKRDHSRSIGTEYPDGAPLSKPDAIDIHEEVLHYSSLLGVPKHRHYGVEDDD